LRSEEQILARKKYIQIINNAKQENRIKKRGIFSGYETHHILPKAKTMFPNWKKEKRNLIFLTPKEHYESHRLLTIIWPCYATFFGWNRITHDGNHNFITINEYEVLRKNISELAKIQSTGNCNAKGAGKRTPEQCLRIKNGVSKEGLIKRAQGSMKKVICINTGETFNSLQEVCNKFGIAKSKLSTKLKNHKKWKNYQFVYG